jgi:hypothetical protein
MALGYNHNGQPPNTKVCFAWPTATNVTDWHVFHVIFKNTTIKITTMISPKIKTILLAIGITLSINTLAQPTQTAYLSGTGNANTVEWDFFCTSGRNSGKWTKIAVPSCWEQQGFGNYNYGYDAAEKRFTEQGLYKKSFDVPQTWKGNIIYIVFEGCMTDAEVKINGKLAGPIHQGAFYRFKYDISKLVNVGKSNLLEVKVSKSSANKASTLPNAMPITGCLGASSVLFTSKRCRKATSPKRPLKPICMGISRPTLACRPTALPMKYSSKSLIYKTTKWLKPHRQP